MSDGKLNAIGLPANPDNNDIDGLFGVLSDRNFSEASLIKSPKSPLRYPGGKSRAVKRIMSFIPSNIESLCSPFFGGGSVELACAGMNTKVYGYDIFSPLIDFWHEVLQNPQELAERVENYFPLSRERFYSLQKSYMDFDNKKEKAAVFYVLNRSSFSGTTLSGGMSPGHKRFNQSSIERVRNFRVSNLHVENKDFKDSLPLHKDDFLYLDPPYANGQAIYGNRGDTHRDFDHKSLAEILSNRERWILSYNDCELVRNLYKDFQFVNLEWNYGMNSSKKSNEILILSKDMST